MGTRNKKPAERPVFDKHLLSIPPPRIICTLLCTVILGVNSSCLKQSLSINKEELLDLYTAVLLGGSAMPLEDLENGNHLANGPFVSKDEEVAAAILDELGVPWQFETLRFMQLNEAGEIVSESSGDLVLLLGGRPLIVEVKSSKIGSRHQKQHAMRAGYGFAYLTGLLKCCPERRIRKVQAAIEQAELSWARAEQMARSGWRRLMRVEHRVHMRLERVA